MGYKYRREREGKLEKTQSTPQTLKKNYGQWYTRDINACLSNPKASRGKGSMDIGTRQCKRNDWIASIHTSPMAAVAYDIVEMSIDGPRPGSYNCQEPSVRTNKNANGGRRTCKQQRIRRGSPDLREHHRP
mmetsp:Transcript_8288/g.51623  ORF Transcript_8288/g.51623 Transcript_8288/m.51623 type:complete len:131 (-) Transcript_8288:780-1172(-)